MNLLERIDIALQHAGKSRSDGAKAMGLSTQAISNLKRRPGSTLRPENIARLARFLECDLYWLCTGEGGKYVAANTNGGMSFIALEVAKWIEEMDESTKAIAFALLYQLRSGKWPPDFFKEPPATARPSARR